MPCKRFHGKICHRAKIDDYAKIAGFKGVDGNLSAGIGDVSDNITLCGEPSNPASSDENGHTHRTSKSGFLTTRSLRSPGVESANAIARGPVESHIGGTAAKVPHSERKIWGSSVASSA